MTDKITPEQMIEALDRWKMTPYDIITHWWDELFCNTPHPLDRNGEYLYKDDTILNLVKTISEIEK